MNDNIKQIDVNEVFISIMDKLKTISIIDQVAVYDGESIEDLRNSVLQIRPGKFVNVYIDYVGGEPYNSNQNYGVDEKMRILLYIVGKRDVNNYDVRLKNTSSVCFTAKAEIAKTFYMDFVNQPFYFPTVFGTFRKYFSDKLNSECVSCYVQELNYTACIYKHFDYNAFPSMTLK